MAVPQTSGNFWFQPATKRQADVLALKVFCLGSFILLGLIIAGVSRTPLRLGVTIAICAFRAPQSALIIFRDAIVKEQPRHFRD